MIDTDKYEGHTKGSWVYNYTENIIAGDEEGNTWTIDLHHFYDGYNAENVMPSLADVRLITAAPDLLAEVKRLQKVINKAMQQHTVLKMREQLFESCCIDAEGQYKSGHWERVEE